MNVPPCVVVADCHCELLARLSRPPDPRREKLQSLLDQALLAEGATVEYIVPLAKGSGAPLTIARKAG